MSPAVLAWLAVGTGAAGLAAVWLLRASNKPQPAVKNGYRWLAIAACCWGIGGIAQQVFSGLNGVWSLLQAADLVSFAALPALVAGVAALTAQHAVPGAGSPAGSGRPAGESAPVGQAYSAAADGGLLIASLFVIGWVTLFGPDYTGAGVGPGGFAFHLIRPVADLVTMAVALPFAVRNPRLALLPVLALAAMTVSDSLAVGARIVGTAIGGVPSLAWIAGLCLLATAPSPPAWVARLIGGDTVRGRLDLAAALLSGGGQAHPRSRGSRLIGRDVCCGPETLVALGAATVAALVVTGFALGGGPVASPTLAVSGAVLVLALVIRLAGLARQAAVVAVAARDGDRMFRALADTTSDAVVVCDLAGSIEFASPAVAEFGYAPGRLIGQHLADLVHPEDRRDAQVAALAALRAADGRGGSREPDGGAGRDIPDGRQAPPAAFAGRVKSADGSWRHVECALSLYSLPGQPVRLLATARDVSDRVALRRQLTHLTFHDGLTGLPNRAFVEERVKDLLGAEMAGAILIDLDGYTSVNDLIGRGGGDLLIAQAGRRLRSAAPPQATVARWGGDEFAILLADTESERDIVDLAERLASMVAAEPFSAVGVQIPLTASIGVALTPVSSAAHLLSNADVAMSRAKGAGGGRVEVFAEQMHADVQRRLELAAGLQQAMTGQQLELEYQPVVELATSRVTTVEALVRWHRNGETIPPAEFLPVAEDSGLIVPLGDWVLREACRQVMTWRTAGLAIGLAVNMSVRQVSAPGLAASVLAALDGTGLPPDALTLEVPERALIDGGGPVVTELAGLRGRGIRLAIDDFGTGYASLSYLPQLAVDTIKIDPEFIAGLGTDPTLTLLTKTIVQVCHDLGVEVVAEGVERPDQLDQLREIGCDLGQGFAIAAPMAPPEVAGFMARRAASGTGAGPQAGAPACSPAG
jgi:diguanylate cyclase (GGDEF)-like protein